MVSNMGLVLKSSPMEELTSEIIEMAYQTVMVKSKTKMVQFTWANSKQAKSMEQVLGL